MMNQKTVDSYPSPNALCPVENVLSWKINCGHVKTTDRNVHPTVENVSSWKIDCGGRGDNRKKIHCIISDRVKYNSF